MQVMCTHYTNDKRLALVMDKLTQSRDVSVMPLRGSLVRSGGTTRCIGNVLECLVFCDKSAPVLMTNSPAYASCNGKMVEYDTCQRDNIYVQALRLCKDKFETSGNPFTMECVIDGGTVVASATRDRGLAYYVRTTHGEVITEAEDIPRQLYERCSSVKSFRYSVVTSTCEKEISVKKGQVEVFREIAHYINKALVFVKVADGVVVREYSITSTGCCEVIRGKNGDARMVKLPFTRVEVDPACALLAIDVPLDAFMRSHSFSDALRRGVQYA